MAPEKRKISSLRADDTNVLLSKLREFRSSLDENDEDLPTGLQEKLQELSDELENMKHTSFSRVDSTTLVSMKITFGPLFLVESKRQEIEEQGCFQSDEYLSMATTQFLIQLVRTHVARVTEAGCRILINMILLRVTSVMSVGSTAVNIIPEFPIAKTTFAQGSGKFSFSGVADFLVTKLGSKYTEYLLGDPVIALANCATMEGPVTSSIFEAKRDNVRAAVPQSVLAAASYCKQQKIPVMRGCISSGEQWIFFTYKNNNDSGGSVRISEEFELGPNMEGLPLILGLLIDCINHATESQSEFFTLN